jgi:hypothetical protein
MRLARSWDRMRFPLPFARGFAVVGAPVAVARDGAADALPAIAAALTAACETADAMAKVGGGEPPPNPLPSLKPKKVEGGSGGEVPFSPRPSP